MSEILVACFYQPVGCCSLIDDSSYKSYCTAYCAAYAVDGLAHYGVYQSPCSDHCQELRRQEERLLAMRSRGLALRRDYLKAGFDNGNNEEVCLFCCLGKFLCLYYMIFTVRVHLHEL